MNHQAAAFPVALLPHLWLERQAHRHRLATLLALRSESALGKALAKATAFAALAMAVAPTASRTR